jgi:cytochrome c biogenesis protein ResB
MSALKVIGSIRLTVLLLAAVAAASLAGTLLPQETAHGAVYRALWFSVLLGALAVNLAACTLNQLPLRLRKLGPVLTRASILLILAGALVDGIFGERGTMVLETGRSSDTFVSPGEKTKLPFGVRLARLQVERHPAGPVTSLRSTLQILDGGRPVKEAVVQVNRPLSHEGYTFFQSSYDRERAQWSGIEVVHDPGVPLVYAGYALLVAGLILTFFVQPSLARRGEDGHE